ncbi:hypothetical protein K402DRAFT_394577, partial [Aulographum hederae CBS 113979]
MAEPDPDDDGEGPANPSQTESPESPLDVAQFYERSQLFNPALYKKKTVNEFIDYVLNSYKVGGLNDEVLTKQFCEDFAMFDRSNWAPVDKSRLATIKLSLRNNGCYVPTGTKRGTPAELEHVIKNSLQWPLNDPRCLAYIINKIYERRERSEHVVGSNSPRSFLLSPPRLRTEPVSYAPLRESASRAPPATDRRSTPFAPSPHGASTSLEPSPVPHPSPQTPPIQQLPPLLLRTEATEATESTESTEATLPTLVEMIPAVQKEQSSPDNPIIALTKTCGDKDERFLDKFSTFIHLLQRAGVSTIPLMRRRNSRRLKIARSRRQTFGAILLKSWNQDTRLKTVFKSQQKQTSCIRLLDSTFTKADYVKQRALGAYVATVSQPEASFALSYAAQITEPTWDDAQFLNRCLQRQISAPGLGFVPLDETSLRLIAYTDSSFANNRDHSSQIGYVIVLADKDGNANMIHWHVLASELYALSLGFDVAATLRSTMNHLFSGSPQGESTLRIPMTLCLDTTQEKRLMIDILCLRQSYERKEISEILWIKGEKNPADAMTKKKHCDALKRLITTSKVDLDQLNGWVDRE